MTDGWIVRKPGRIIMSDILKVGRSLMSPISKTLASSALAAVLSLPANAQGIVTQKNITLALAQTIANAAIAQCRTMGYRISVTVVDREGLPIIMMRDDGAGLSTPEGKRSQGLHRACVQPAFGGFCQA